MNALACGCRQDGDGGAPDGGSSYELLFPVNNTFNSFTTPFPCLKASLSAFYLRPFTFTLIIAITIQLFVYFLTHEDLGGKHGGKIMRCANFTAAVKSRKNRDILRVTETVDGSAI